MTVLFSHIEHYLNPEGIKNFSTWYNDLKSLFLQQEGFISINYAYDPDDESCIHIWTEFKDLKTAEQWAQSQTKINIQMRLDPFRTKPMLVERYFLQDY